jgi:hypothetical protein
VLPSINRTHLPVRPLKLLVVLSVLSPLEPVEKVVSEGFVKVESETGGDFGGDSVAERRVSEGEGGEGGEKGKTNRFLSSSSFCR